VSKINDLFKQDLKVINMGIESFYHELKDQDVDVIQMNWKPPASGNEKMNVLLSKLKERSK